MAKASKNTAAPVAATAEVNMGLLTSFATASQFVDPTPDIVALRDAGLIAVDESNVVNGQAHASITEVGTKYLAASAPASAETAPASTESRSAFSIMSFGAPPPKVRRTEGMQKYKIQDLAAPDMAKAEHERYAGIFVPATKDRPEPWRKLTSTISQAAKKLNEGKTGDDIREFRVFEHVGADGIKGAAIVRTK